MYSAIIRFYNMKTEVFINVSCHARKIDNIYMNVTIYILDFDPRFQSARFFSYFK